MEEQHTEQARTLAIDCGGSGIKGSVLDHEGHMVTEQVRVTTPYPLPPERFLHLISEMAAGLPTADRATIGIPGMIRHGVVVATPHYVTKSGPFSARDPKLVAAWDHFDAQAQLQATLGVPTLVVNDAEVHAAAVATGEGFEVLFTLGTGLGCAIFDNGIRVPKLEVSRSPVRKGVIYDEWLGDKARRHIGNKAWSIRVREAIEGLRPMFLWDRCYVGGGNSARLKVALAPDITVVPNEAGILGGMRLWEMGNR